METRSMSDYIKTLQQQIEAQRKMMKRFQTEPEIERVAFENL